MSDQMELEKQPIRNVRKEVKEAFKKKKHSFRGGKIFLLKTHNKPKDITSLVKLKLNPALRSKLSRLLSLVPNFIKNTARQLTGHQPIISHGQDKPRNISLHNFIKPASQVKSGCDYSIFKKGIRPMWEDRMNEKGGRWIVKFDSRPRDVDINKIWLDVILLIIGGELDDYRNEVCGAILNVRARCDKIAIWTPSIHKANEILGIGRKLKDCLKYEKKLKLDYESHESAEKKSSKNRYLYSL